MVGPTSGRTGGRSAPAAVSPFQFDLEKNLKDPAHRQEVLQKVEARIAQLREQLRAGGSQQTFDQLTTLLNAFTSLKRVIERSKGGRS
jgi:hypothetical protein